MPNLTCVILAAHSAPQLLPLTLSLPKALLEVKGKSLIEYNLEALSSIVDRFVIVTNHLEDTIKQRIGTSFNNKAVEYVHQSDIGGGTLGAFRTGVYNSTNFDPQDCYIVSNSDDIHGKDIYMQFHLSIIDDPGLALISAKILKSRNKLGRYGVLEIEPVTGHLLQVVEKPNNYVSSLVNTGIYYLPAKILEFLERQKEPGLNRQEYITEDLFNRYSQLYPIKVMPTLDKWLPMGSLEEFEKANKS